MATANVTIRAELRELKKSLAEVPEITDREAKKMVNKLEAQYKKAERAAKKSFNSQKKSSEESFNKMRSLGEKTGSFLGGTFGELSELALEFTEEVGGVGEALGGWKGKAALAAGGIAVATAAAGILAKVMYDVGVAGVEALDRLEEMNRAALVDPEARDRIEKLKDAQDGLSIAADVLKTKVASELQPALTEMTWTLVGVIDAATKAQGAIEKITDALVWWGEMSAKLNLTDDFVFWAAGLAGIEVQTVAVSAATEDLKKKYQDLSSVLPGDEDFVGPVVDNSVLAERAKKESEAAAAAKKAADEKSKAQEQLQSIIEQSHMATLAGEEKIRAEFDKRIAKVQELGKITGDAAAEEAALRQLAIEEEQALTKFREEQAKKAEELEKKRLEAAKKAEEERLEVKKAATELAAEMDRMAQEQALANLQNFLGGIELSIGVLEDSFDLIRELGNIALEQAYDNASKEADKRRELADERDRIASEISSAESKEEKIALRAKLEAIDEDLKAQRQAAKEAGKAARERFKAQKKLQRGSVFIDAAAATVAALAANAGLVFSPGFIAAVAGITATTTASIAKINAQKPPKFHMGGLAGDEVPAVLRQGEAVLSQRGTQDIVNAINQGMLQGSNRSQPVVVHVYIDGKEVAANVDVSGNNRGQRSVYRRG